MSPHLGHLWATTCPQDPNWQAGEEHSSGYHFDPKRNPGKSGAKMKNAAIPLFPRPIATSVCGPGVQGEFSVGDTTNWSGVRGLVLIRAEALVTGLNMRDEYARRRILQTLDYPDIRFVVDSLANVRPGDTLRADAVGVLELHGVKRPWVVPLKAWHEPLGLRVTGTFEFPATDMVDVYHIPEYPLALGVQLQIWKTLHLGIDAILVPAAHAPAGSAS
jgi:hypothetical protein